VGACSTLLAHEREPFVLREDLHAGFFRLGKFRAGAGTGNDVMGFFRNRARDMGSQPLGHGLGFVPRHFFQRTGKNDRLSNHRRIRRRSLRGKNVDLVRESLDNATIVLLAEIGGDAVDHGVADLVEVVHLGPRLGVTLGDQHAGVVERLP